MYLNRIEIIGFVGRDAETRYLNNGKPVTSFSVATNKRFKDAKGNQQNTTQWHHCVVYGPLTDFAGKLKSGAHVRVEGEHRTREYEREVAVGKETTIKIPALAVELVARSISKLDRAKAAAAADAVPEADPVAPEGHLEDETVPF